MPRADQADRRSGLRPVKCTKKSKQSQQQCRNWAVVGSVPPVCRIHGGGKGDVKAKADLRVVASQLGLAGLEPTETIHVIQKVLSEQFLRAAGQLEAAAAEGRPVDPLEHQRFVDSADRSLVAARLALSTVVSNAAEIRTEAEGEAVELTVNAVTWTIDAVLSLVPLDGDDRLRVREYGMAMARWALEGAQSERPKPPNLAVAEPGPAVVRAELLPGPRRRRAVDADSIWAAAEQIIDVEVEEDDDDDDDAVADSA